MRIRLVILTLIWLFGPFPSSIPPLSFFLSIPRPSLLSSEDPVTYSAYDMPIDNLKFYRLRTVKLKLGLVFKHLVFDQTWHELMISLASALEKIGHEIQVLTLEDGPIHSVWSDYGFHVHVIETINTVNWLNYSAVFLNSIEAVDIMCWLSREPFKSVPVIWTVRDGQLPSLLKQKYSIDGIDSWRGVFSRANAVVFPNYNLTEAYAVVDSGNYFVIPELPTELGEPIASDITLSKSIEGYALLLESIIGIPPAFPAQDVPEFVPVRPNWKELSRRNRNYRTDNFLRKVEGHLDYKACDDGPKACDDGPKGNKDDNASDEPKRNKDGKVPNGPKGNRDDKASDGPRKKDAQASDGLKGNRDDKAFDGPRKKDVQASDGLKGNRDDKAFDGPRKKDGQASDGPGNKDDKVFDGSKGNRDDKASNGLRKKDAQASDGPKGTSDVQAKTWKASDGLMGSLLTCKAFETQGKEICLSMEAEICNLI